MLSMRGKPCFASLALSQNSVINTQRLNGCKQLASLANPGLPGGETTLTIDGPGGPQTIEATLASPSLADITVTGANGKPAAPVSPHSLCFL